MKNRKILIVDDEPTVREGVREWLLEDGYSVDCVETGEQALERIKNEEFGLIVIDLKLPGIDGLQVFEEVKGLKPKTQGVIITAYPTKETIEKGERLGILEYLPKPFNVVDLEKIIRNALGELDEEKIDRKNLWLQIGAISYRLCDRNYDCSLCSLAEAIQDTSVTQVLISEDEVTNLKQQPDNQKFCRYGSVHLVHRDKPYLE